MIISQCIGKNVFEGVKMNAVQRANIADVFCCGLNVSGAQEMDGDVNETGGQETDNCDFHIAKQIYSAL